MSATLNMNIKKGVKLSKYTTFKIGGKASYFVEVESIKELRESLIFAQKNKLKNYVIAGGSNILIPDEGLNGLVIKINIKGIKFLGKSVLVGAGEDWDDFVKKTLSKNLYGLENLSGIPGSVGATPIQNVGAYGVEVSNFIKKVETLDKRNLKIKTFSNKDCKFGYRDSFFKTKIGQNFVITKVIFSLNKKYKPNISYKDLKNYFKTTKTPTVMEVRKAVLKIRRGKFPDLKKVGTAGSFFKNPVISAKHYKSLLKKNPQLPGFEVKNNQVKIPLAYILDKILGLTGFGIKNVALYKKQPLVFVNLNKAKQRDILKLQKEIEKKVFYKTKIKIFPEVTFLK